MPQYLAPIDISLIVAMTYTIPFRCILSPLPSKDIRQS